MPPLATMPNAGIPAGAREAEDMTDEDWSDLRRTLGKLLSEEAEEPEHAEDEKRSHFGAGIMFVEPSGAVLFLKRGDKGDHPGKWAFPGGTPEDDESPEQTALREAIEETGHKPAHALKLVDDGPPSDDEFFAAFGARSPRFRPVLNDEHTDYVWAHPSAPPQPLHPAVAGMFGRLKGLWRDQLHDSLPSEALAADAPSMDKETAKYTDGPVNYQPCGECSMFRDGRCTLVKGAIAPAGHCEHFDAKIAAADQGTLKGLESGVPEKGELRGINATDSRLRLPLAMDRDSLRKFDDDGRMRVAVTNISKANVCPYRGDEIPGWDPDTETHALGLEPDRIYKLLRAPDELRKSVPTWNGIQLLRDHVPVDVADHRKHDIVGTTGTDAAFDGTYLTNSLIFWSLEGIDLVESGKQRELSCGYHYDPDMTPGTFNGEAYDGVMRNIRGNHVALVEEGRAGPDVVVADSLATMQWAMVEDAMRAL